MHHVGVSQPRDDDFFEEDEPLEKVLAAFERGEKGVTARPTPTGSVQHPNETTVVVNMPWGSAAPDLAPTASSFGLGRVVMPPGFTLVYGVRGASGAHQDPVPTSS